MTDFEHLSNRLQGARIIVTGASGFIGLNLLKKLSAYNASILVIDRNQPAEHIPRVEFEWADLRHLNKVYEADFLIHLAAITNSGYAEKYPLETYEVNVLGTVNLLNHVKIKERILFPSTALIYKASEIPLDEHSVMDVSATYAQSKFIGEQITEFRSKLMEVPYTIVRFFNIYGPGQQSMYIVPQILRQVFEDRVVVLRNGSVMRDMLYVEDCMNAVTKLLVTDKARNSVFNIGSGRKVSILDIAKSIVSVSNYKDVEIQDKKESIYLSPSIIMANIGKLQATIDWCPQTSLTEGFEKTWKSYIRPS